MKLLVRIVVFGAALILGLGLFSWPWAAMIVPGVSPFVTLLSALTARQLALPALLALPLLLLGLFKGRWFCRRLCPPGFILNGCDKLNRRYPDVYLRFPSIGGWLVGLAAGTALAGYSWFLWLDPLVLFNGFCGVWRQLPLTWSDGLPAAGLGVVIILTIFCPHLWCERCCPLGALQVFLGRGGQWARQVLFRAQDSRQNRTVFAQPADFRSGLLSSRRTVLALLSGGGLAFLARFVRRDTDRPIRPPGAVAESRFPGLCVRCGNCMNACPQRMLVPDLGQSGWGGVLTPIADFERNYCDEWCYRCTQVCPTGAIRRLTLEEKRMLAMGLAQLDRTRCIAWSDQQTCLVCGEFCPYLAIRALDQRGVPCPEVNPALCRGCGACQKNCPALPGKAIIVRGLAQHPVREPAGVGGRLP